MQLRITQTCLKSMGALTISLCLTSAPQALASCEDPPPGCETNYACLDTATRADVSENGIVGSEDLTQLLGLWTSPHQPPPGPCTRLDLNDDGLIDSRDLTQLLGAWGPIPLPPSESPPVCP
jgi:hypothetical protein